MENNAAIARKQPRGRLSGMDNLLRRELSAWWSTHRWWKHALFWAALINGFIPPLALLLQSRPETGLDLRHEVTAAIFVLGGMLAAIGAVVAAQGAIVEERERGTAAWVLSKPVTRSAFVLSKFLAHALSLMLLAAALPTALAYLQAAYWLREWLPPLPYLAGLGLVVLYLLHYVAFTLMLGTLAPTRGWVLGGALGLLFGGPMLLDFLPALVQVTPFKLPDFAAALAGGMPLAELPLGTVGSTVLLVVLYLSVALWRFEQEEL